MADDVRGGDQGNRRDHDHIGEAEREPEPLLRLRRGRVEAEVMAELGEAGERPVGPGDEEETSDGEADRHQTQAEDDEPLGSLPRHGGRILWNARRAGPVAVGTSHGRSAIASVSPSYGATRARAVPMIRP